jgi:hypothetical protein
MRAVDCDESCRDSTQGVSLARSREAQDGREGPLPDSLYRAGSALAQ